MSGTTLTHPATFLFRKGLLNVILALVFCIALQPCDIAGATEEIQTPKVTELIEADQEEKIQTKQAETIKAVPADRYDRGTPRSSILGISKALSDKDYERALNYLDLRNLPYEIRSQGAELARQLKIIAERSLWVDIETVSDDQHGHRGDDLPEYQDIIARLKTPNGPVDILLQRIPDAQGKEVWKVSNETVAEIPHLYQHFGYGEYGDKLSRILPDFDLFGVELWQWIMLLGIGLGAYLISWVPTLALRALVSLVKQPPFERINRFIRGPVRFVIFILIGRANFDLISPTFTAKAFYEANTLLIIAIVWLINGGIDLAFGRLGDRMRANGNEHATVLLRPTATLIKVVVWLIALISWLDNLGFNVTTMIAGLGVGGIAVGLAAQKSIENLIAAITLYVAEPVRIGDFCRVGTTWGVVDEIGLRFTTIRTLDRTQLTISNSNFADMEIENLTRRDKILHRRTLRLRNDTKPDQIRTVLEDVRNLLQSHKDIDPSPARIRFTEYGEHSLNLDIFTYIKTKDFNEYLAIVEDLNLRILDIVSAAGAQLALPARSIRLEGEVSTADGTG